MNESFSYKRFLALIQLANWRLLLLYPIVIIIAMALVSVISEKEINLMGIANGIFVFAHMYQFQFMANSRNLSRFLLLPASISEKYFALITGSILIPIFSVSILMGVKHYFFDTLPLSFFDSIKNSNFFFVAILMFSCLVYLRLQMRLNITKAFLLIFLAVIIILIFENRLHQNLLNHNLSTMLQGLFFILLSVSLLALSYPAFKRLDLKHLRNG